jgi:hypothetical protein
MDVLIVILDTIIVVLAILVCIYSFKLVLCLNGSIPSNWWGVMPIAFLWATINRVLVLMTALEIISGTEWLDWIAAGTIVFWILILVFKIGFYRELKKVLCPDEEGGCK